MQTTVDESTLRGKVTVATKNYLPGELILEEEPILIVTKEHLAPFMTSNQVSCRSALVSAAYYLVQKHLSREEKAQVLAMFGPVNDPKSVEARQTLRSSTIIGMRMSNVEIEVYVKLTSIMKRHKFGLGEDWLLLPRMSAFDHSCEGNCHWRMSRPTVMQVRAVRHIQAGEELKFAFNPKESRKYTHERRQYYLEEYGFTCHCPRCDAPGDDTRQFDCFDPACKGVMMVCQPINKNKVSPPDLSYTGVECVEPHLLPCTECHQAAPAAYQTKMLALEAQLWDLIGKFTRQENALGRVPAPMAYLRLQREIESHQLPMRHSLCVFVYRVLLRTAPPLHLSGKLPRSAFEAEWRARVLGAARALIAAQERLCCVANRMLLEMMDEAIYESIMVVDGMPLPLQVRILPADAKAMLQQALRLLMVLQGREVCAKGCTCRVGVDTHLLEALAQLPVSQQVRDMQVCAFCEESPLCAAMKLSRCGKCKKVVYCGGGCQKAHWKLHKKTCGV